MPALVRKAMEDICRIFRWFVKAKMGNDYLRARIELRCSLKAGRVRSNLPCIIRYAGLAEMYLCNCICVIVFVYLYLSFFGHSPASSDMHAGAANAMTQSQHLAKTVPFWIRYYEPTWPVDQDEHCFSPVLDVNTCLNQICRACIVYDAGNWPHGYEFEYTSKSKASCECIFFGPTFASCEWWFWFWPTRLETRFIHSTSIFWLAHKIKSRKEQKDANDLRKRCISSTLPGGHGRLAS